jgi:tetratricopeptide (TPR) repeat protein
MDPEIFRNPVFSRCYRRWQAQPGSTAFVGVADILRVRGEFDEAIRVCRDGLRHQPALVTGRLVLAQCLAAVGRRPDAHALALGILRDHPDHMTAQQLLAEVRPHEHQLPTPIVPVAAASVSEDTVEVVLDGPEAFPDADEEPTPVIALIMDEAEPHRHDEAPERRSVGPVTMTMGRLYLSQGHRHEAEHIFRKILEGDPGHRDARDALATLWAQQDR